MAVLRLGGRSFTGVGLAPGSRGRDAKAKTRRIKHLDYIDLLSFSHYWQVEILTCCTSSRIFNPTLAFVAYRLTTTKKKLIGRPRGPRWLNSELTAFDPVRAAYLHHAHSFHVALRFRRVPHTPPARAGGSAREREIQFTSCGKLN